MNAIHNPVWSTLDTFDVDLRSYGASEAMQRLVAALAHHRARTDVGLWKQSCTAVDSHPALRLLLEDPYARDARTKPCGYAGDARTLDYVYLQDPGSPSPTREGRALFDVATSVPIAAAVRARSAVLADVIVRRAEQGPVRVASIACGHARELDRVSGHLSKQIRFWGIDQDADSVAYCRSRLDPANASVTVASVRDLLTGRLRLPASDLVYASGLFDYLDQRAGALLVKRMVAAVNVGGSVIIPNLTPHNEEVGYMEAVMDWWMVYRTEDDMRQLASAAGLDPTRTRATTFSTSGGRVAWLQIDRLA